MLYGLMDCNNFFVSCERVFRPDLDGRPVVVLSNNDGCVVSRSNEAKEMGIPMGVPFFRLSEYDPLGKVTAFSSNYVLYADLSRRVMSILADRVGETIPYSIDECFFCINGSDEEAERICAELPAIVRQWTGIPVSVGLAPTKTLAKSACRFAKKFKGFKGFCSLVDAEKRRKATSLVKLSDVWGVGRRSIKKLNNAGFYTAADLCNASEYQVRRLLGVNGVRIWGELRGDDSVETSSNEDSRKSICTSRSFAEMVTSIDELRTIVANFASMAAARLRTQHSVANIVSVYVTSNTFREDLRQYSNIFNVALPVATSSQMEIVRAACVALSAVFRKDVAYKKAGVLLSGISPDHAVAQSLFSPRTEINDKMDRLSKVVDILNKSEGANTVHLASQLLRNGQAESGSEASAEQTHSKDLFLANLRREHISPRYTTSWDEIMKLH